jgi:hypothetical protein
MDQTEAAPGYFVPEEQMMLDRHPLVHELAPDGDPAPVDQDELRHQDALDSADLDSADEAVPDYPDPPRTGDPAVDEVIDAVARAVGGPLEEQLAVYDAAYRTLQDRLADVEG